jgi:hypothetical protein
LRLNSHVLRKVHAYWQEKSLRTAPSYDPFFIVANCSAGRRASFPAAALFDIRDVCEIETYDAYVNPDTTRM